MYSRLFITMKADAAGYGFGGRAPAGRCILEVRGSVLKAVLTVQDIKPNVNYKVYIVEKPNEMGMPPHGVQVGNLAVDAQGRGELRKEFDGAFAGKLYFDEIGVVVLAVSKEAGDDTPLVGFVDDEFANAYNWKNFVSERKEHQKKKDTADIDIPTETLPVEHDDSAIMEQAYVGSGPLGEINESVGIEAAELQQPEEDIDKGIDVEAAELPPTDEDTNEGTDIETAEIQLPEEESEESIDEPTQDIKQQNLDAQDELFKQNEVERIFAGNVQLQPFVREDTSVKWVRVSLRELVVLPIKFWRIMNNPLIVLCSEKYGHLILGRDEQDSTQLFLGVPALYDNQLLPGAQSMGFSQFKCCEDKQPAADDHGYWIMPLKVS